MSCITGTMAFAEGVSSCDEGDSLFIIHRHARKSLAHVAARCDRVRLSVRSFRVYVDQAHLHGCEWIVEFTVAFIARVSKPLVFRTPVDVFFRLPDVLAPASEAEGLKAHRLQCTVSCKDQQVGPGDFLAIFLFDRPEQSARLVQVDVVRPAVEWRKTLRT